MHQIVAADKSNKFTIYGEVLLKHQTIVHGSTVDVTIVIERGDVC